MTTRVARHLPRTLLRTGLVSLALAVLVAAPIEASTDGSGIHLAAARGSDAAAAPVKAGDGDSAARYWTKERMERSIPADLHVKADRGEHRDAGNGPAGRGSPVEIKGEKPAHGAPGGSPDGAASEASTSPAAAGTTATAAATSGGTTEGYWQSSNTANPNRQVGRLFYQQWDPTTRTWKDYNCSGTVVASESGSVVWTAGHCVYNTYANTWNRNYTFCPGYRAASCALGKWSAYWNATTPAWQNATCDARGYCSEYEFQQDFGALKVSPINGWTVQAWVGAQGIAFFGAKTQARYLFGYPLNKSNGEYLYYCAGTNTLVNAGGTQVNLMMNPCGAGGGASGGPWLSGINASWTGTVHSVNSHGGTGTMAGPYQGTAAQTLYNGVRY